MAIWGFVESKTCPVSFESSTFSLHVDAFKMLFDFEMVKSQVSELFSFRKWQISQKRPNRPKSAENHCYMLMKVSKRPPIKKLFITLYRRFILHHTMNSLLHYCYPRHQSTNSRLCHEYPCQSGPSGPTSLTLSFPALGIPNV